MPKERSKLSLDERVKGRLSFCVSLRRTGNWSRLCPPFAHWLQGLPRPSVQENQVRVSAHSLVHWIEDHQKTKRRPRSH